MPLVRILWPAVAIALFGMWPVSAATPSFDCTRAETAAENLVCGDEELAMLDREIARLFVLAHNALSPNSPRLPELIGTQRGWIKARDACWKETDARFCVLSSYAIRIYELRESYAGARRQDAKGISKGPMVVECPNFGSVVSATFIQTDPPIVDVTWRNMVHLVLTQGPSGSGARYVGTYDNGEVVFWNKGREALFEMPGKGQFNCQIREPG